MAREKLLVLESAWRPAPGRAPTESRSAGEIYASVQNLPPPPEIPVACLRRPLLARDYADTVKQFVDLPVNRKGPNVIVFSSHGDAGPQGQAHSRLATDDGHIELRRAWTELAGHLERSIVILDACHLGENLEAMRRASGALGILGFSGRVDWLASSILVLAVLRRFAAHGVFAMQRRSAARPRKLLQNMQQGEYHTLMRELGLEFVFA